MKIHIHRQGAFGDCVIVTPVIRYFHNQGHEVYIVSSDRGEQVLRHNPHVTKLIELKKDEYVNEALGEHIQWLKRKYHCDRVIDLSESIEVKLSMHPHYPEYKRPKFEKILTQNRNFYEFTMELCDIKWSPEDLNPELFFTEQELSEARSYLKPGKFNILVGMSGSGNNKAYPWTEDMCLEMAEKNPEFHIITVGDERCRLIEPEHPNITNLSGKIPMRGSMALTGVVDLLISPDTGLLHASGCFKTPKIGLLGHNTIECITKHFENDYSLESDQDLVPCSPCFFLIQDIYLQCNVDENTGGAFCMSKGINPTRVIDQVSKVYAKHQERL
jgi:ADP-heptose:LPS heptosyltransferase